MQKYSVIAVKRHHYELVVKANSEAALEKALREGKLDDELWRDKGVERIGFSTAIQQIEHGVGSGKMKAFKVETLSAWY